MRKIAALVLGLAMAVIPAAAATAAPAHQGPTKVERQAIGSAQDYLRLEGFSRLGLIDQLDSHYGDGYPEKVAVYAVDHIRVNWNTEAVRSAKSYLQMEGFSKAGLINQLDSRYGNQYTRSQAVYAVAHIKVNWNLEAVQSAKSYLRIEHYSKAGLIQQLTEGDLYTLSQATYAVNREL